ncbi:MAG: hypothetical protein J5586_07135 [Clostridia bacterium]|nr:hypothetical protein [Clostridia bacterium]
MKKRDEHSYDDIIGLPHHKSSSRPHMSNADRAAQFAPFAALTGYDEAVAETARLTAKKPELAEDEKAIIDGYLQFIREDIGERPMVGITYFRPDARKSGGDFIEKYAPALAVDEVLREIVFTDGTRVPIDDIVSVDAGFRGGFEFELY